MKKISWGQVINAVRDIHINFYKQFPYEYVDISLVTEFFPPPSLETFCDWAPTEVPDELIEVIEQNAVERLLIENSLSPFEEFSVQNETEVGFIVKQILMLEREWLAQMHVPLKLSQSNEPQLFLEQCVQKLSHQLSGRPNLKAV